MASLQDILTAPSVRSQVVDRCVRLIDSEVAQKSGISGMAIKAAYKLVQKVKPGFVADVTNRLLPEFARALEPMFVEAAAQAEGGSEGVGPLFRAKVAGDRERAADALLGVTDAKIESARPAIKKTYEKLRGGAKGHVAQAVPGLADAIAPFL